LPLWEDEVGKNIHFPARGSASGALAAFIKKILYTETLYEPWSLGKMHD
jgi:hypothetical protein